MIRIEVLGTVADASAVRVFRALRAFEEYPKHTPVVREVRVQPAHEGAVLSDWSVNFRNGVLRWTEEDRFDDDRMEIAFRQVSGDLRTFDGVWSVTSDGENVAVRFVADVDLGIPSLAPLLEPVADRTLRETVQKILRGLVGPAVRFDGEERAPMVQAA